MYQSTSAGGAAEGSQGRARFAPPLDHGDQDAEPWKGDRRITKRTARHIQLRSVLAAQDTLPEKSVGDDASPD